MIEGWAAAAVVVGAAAVGAGASIYGANKQASAARNAQNIAQNQQQQNVALEDPYNQAGMSALSQLDYAQGIGPQNVNGSPAGTGTYGALNQPFTQQNFKDLSPAYTFQLQQGQQGVLNASAANQGALSGAAQKDLIGYSQNFANSSFNNAFNQYQTQNQNVYNRLSNIANLGQSAASGTAQTGTALANTAAAAATNQGNAYANMGTGISNAVNGAAGNVLMSSYLNQNAGYGASQSGASNVIGTTGNWGG